LRAILGKARSDFLELQRIPGRRLHFARFTRACILAVVSTIFASPLLT
jgi:hypothetical protein